MVKVTPDDYIKMNEEFERDGTPIRIDPIPTQEQIDNPTGFKVPGGPFPPQPPMVTDGSDPWPHNKTTKEIDDAFGYDTSGK